MAGIIIFITLDRRFLPRLISPRIVHQLRFYSPHQNAVPRTYMPLLAIPGPQES